MRHPRSHFLLAATVLGLTLPSAAEAQGPPRPGPVPGPVPQAPRPIEGPRGNPAASFLRLRNQLALTEEQVKKLEALRSAPAPRTNPSDLMRARADLMDAMQGDGNLTRARAALDRMSGVRNDRIIAGLKLRQDARAVLTAEQKAKLDNMRGTMRRELRDGMRANRRANRRDNMRGNMRPNPRPNGRANGRANGRGRDMMGPPRMPRRGPGGEQ